MDLFQWVVVFVFVALTKSLSARLLALLDSILVVLHIFQEQLDFQIVIRSIDHLPRFESLLCVLERLLSQERQPIAFARAESQIVDALDDDDEILLQHLNHLIGRKTFKNSKHICFTHKLVLVGIQEGEESFVTLVLIHVHELGGGDAVLFKVDGRSEVAEDSFDDVEHSWCQLKERLLSHMIQLILVQFRLS